ncbi:DHHA1 domain-containing protein [Priestia megaterium]|uniref:single-stranded-DNA-specific exonuclease RecJ n=1 Tax=Priestia megaterium TaxID=1404 RepID=UPI002E1CDB9D|nr:DHHA1 domain-containing protein [Priestia megaterium]MED4285534.1 DHHA1 domain-containing protein [Priestia megaterium]
MISIERLKSLYPYATPTDIDNYKRVLEYIGVNDEGVDGFLNPSLKLFHHPYKMKDLEKALDRLLKAFAENEKILFFGDYDTDGCTTTALFVKVLRDKGIHVDYYVPHRHKDGYGLNATKMKEFAEQYDLIVTGDTGIKEMETIYNCPIDVIVTDHHEPFVTDDEELLSQYRGKADIIVKDGETMVIPSAYAVVNPKRIDCEYPNKCLSGVAVIFKLLQGLFIKNGWKQVDLTQHLDLVATGLVADLVPQFDVEHQDSEVRMMTKVGLQIMNQTPKPWVSSIVEISKIEEINHNALGFVFGPRFNAAGRLDSPFPVVKYLLEDDEEASREKALVLEQYNTDRKELQREATESIVEFLKDKDKSWTDRIVVVKAEPQYHSGIAGLVASRLVGQYNVPAIVLCEKEIDGQIFLTGSCRSTEGIDILSLLQKTEKKMGAYKYGGHEMAAGLTITLEQFDLFRESMRDAALELDDSKFSNTLFYELELPLNKLTLPTVHFIRDTFYKIRLFSPNNKLYSAPTPMKNKENANVYLQKENARYRAALWGIGKDFCEQYVREGFKEIDVVYSAGIWNDRVSLEMQNYRVVY